MILKFNNFYIIFNLAVLKEISYFENNARFIIKYTSNQINFKVSNNIIIKKSHCMF